MAHTIKYFLLTVLCAVFIVLLIAPVPSGGPAGHAGLQRQPVDASTLTAPGDAPRNEAPQKRHHL